MTVQEVNRDALGRCKMRGCNLCDGYRKEVEQYRALGTVEEIKKKIQTELPYMSLAQARFKSELDEYRNIGTVKELKENKDFLEFLYNAIQPNEMEQHLSMYNAKGTKATVTEGYTDQCGLMPTT